MMPIEVLEACLAVDFDLKSGSVDGRIGRKRRKGWTGLLICGCRCLCMVVGVEMWLEKADWQRFKRRAGREVQVDGAGIDPGFNKRRVGIWTEWRLNSRQSKRCCLGHDLREVEEGIGSVSCTARRKWTCEGEEKYRTIQSSLVSFNEGASCIPLRKLLSQVSFQQELRDLAEVRGRIFEEIRVCCVFPAVDSNLAAACSRIWVRASIGTVGGWISEILAVDLSQSEEDLSSSKKELWPEEKLRSWKGT
ncbi:hypothetical protein MA16_Dca003020 [Dendrobium catenatum]|uniref:Uncharacterized protein n=1 Tax=Dendrobium catenatum TaxID=906689 RepID=A0A2I0X9A1_9ASPA|nr:hypothetical protein MA16_Dca003020 [Dendrobium catenatum]